RLGGGPCGRGLEGGPKPNRIMTGHVPRGDRSGRSSLPTNQAHRPRTGNVFEQSFLSYYKNEYLRARSVATRARPGVVKEPETDERQGASVEGERLRDRAEKARHASAGRGRRNSR